MRYIYADLNILQGLTKSPVLTSRLIFILTKSCKKLIHKYFIPHFNQSAFIIAMKKLPFVTNHFLILQIYITINKRQIAQLYKQTSFLTIFNNMSLVNALIISNYKNI